jgi:hypothetical protein
MGFLWFLIIVAVLFLLVQIVGRLLPARYRVQHSDIVDAVPGTVWTILVNHAQEKDWRSDLIEVDRVTGMGPQPVWKEKRRDGTTLLFKTIVSDPPQKLVREVIEHKEFTGTVTYELGAVPERAATRLTVTEDMTVRRPWRRVKLHLLSAKSARVRQFVHDVKQRALHLKELE